MSAGRTPAGVRRLNQRGQLADFSNSIFEKLPLVSRASQWPPSLEIVVTFPWVSILSRPRLKSEKKTFPCRSTTMPELGWPDAVNARPDRATTTETIEVWIFMRRVGRRANSEFVKFS